MFLRIKGLPLRERELQVFGFYMNPLLKPMTDETKALIEAYCKKAMEFEIRQTLFDIRKDSKEDCFFKKLLSGADDVWLQLDQNIMDNDLKHILNYFYEWSCQYQPSQQ